jgi:hypothetical protein
MLLRRATSESMGALDPMPRRSSTMRTSQAVFPAALAGAVFAVAPAAAVADPNTFSSPTAARR